MKNCIIYLSLIVLLLAGCRKKTEDLFGESADARINKVMNNFQDALLRDPGYKLYVYPQGLVSQGVQVGGLTYYMKFTANNRVSMISDFRIDMAQTPKESGYRLKAVQRPSLIFDTYSYIHVAADPDPDVSASPAPDAGYGWGTDFDFGLVETTLGDTILLKGNYNKSDALLIRVSQQEIDNAFSGKLADIIQATADYNVANPLLYFNSTANEKISIAFNLYLYTINFSFLAGGNVITISSPFSHTTTGLHLKQPVTVGGYTFQDLLWDETQQVYYIDAGGTRVDIFNSSVPILPFAAVLGKSITTITVPVDPLPGQSALFDNAYNEVNANLAPLSGAVMRDIRFIFDDASKMMAMQIVIRQGANLPVAQYVYSYTLASNGTAKFIRISANPNGEIVEDLMAPLLDYIDNDVFTLDYYTASSPVLGQFTSQDHPAFFFTGTLQ